MILTLYEPFRHWSETGSVYILSDPHFGDPDCKLMDPGWIEPEEQVARINALVMKNDTFVCLGDVGDASFGLLPIIFIITVRQNHIGPIPVIMRLFGRS